MRFLLNLFIVVSNVLIYFNQNLQNKVQTLFYDSLINLALGSKESIQFTDYFAKYSELDSKATYFQKKNTKMQYQAIVIGVSVGGMSVENYIFSFTC
jgi:hypothetical protein